MQKIPVFFTSEMVVPEGVNGFSPSATKPMHVVNSWKKHGFPITIRYPAKLTAEQISYAHRPTMVREILSGKRANGFGNTSLEVAATLPFTSGSMLAAARSALRSGTVACSPTSGFHHATYDSSGGFCTFNSLMVTAIHLIDEDPNLNVGILDIDAHYGNGTDDIIEHFHLQDRVKHWTFGSHAQRNERKMDQLIATLPQIIACMVNDGCKLIIYQAGADPWVHDPLGGYLTLEQLERRDYLVFRTCKMLGVPVAWNLAGGYAIDPNGKTFEEKIRPVLKIHDATMRVCCEVFSEKRFYEKSA